jgi:hypothetical protein
MHTERWRSGLRTRIRDESFLHSAHRLNPRCIGCCDLTGAGLVPALVTPAALVDKTCLGLLPCVSLTARLLIGSDHAYCTLRANQNSQVIGGIFRSSAAFDRQGYPDNFHCCRETFGIGNCLNTRPRLRSPERKVDLRQLSNVRHTVDI